MNTPILSINNLSIGYGSKAIKEHIHLAIKSNELICILGPNGCGKSTLLRTLANLQDALAGEILLKGLPLHQYGKRLAHEVSVVLTEKLAIGTLTVFEIVALGRYPYTNWMGTLQEKDHAIIHQSLQQVNMEHALNRQVGELSDGEQQRIMLAKALAQDTPLILLDEPTAHLDLPNRVAMMHLLKKLSLTCNKSIVLSTHELDLALQVANTIWLMDTKQPLVEGAPEDLVLSGVFERAFEQDQLQFDRASGIFKIKHTNQHHVLLKGSGIPLYWTQRALERAGFGFAPTQEEPTEEPIEIEIIHDQCWRISNHQAGVIDDCDNLRNLINKLHTIFYNVRV